MLYIIPLNAQRIVPLADYNYEYAVKIVCGEQKDSKSLRLASGFYATTVNIHNPHDTLAIFYKKLALTYPPGNQLTGEIIPLGVDTLIYDQALQTDGNDIRNHYKYTSYIEGFVIIQSTVSLDVSAVYSTSAKSGCLWRSGYKVVSMDVENIRERKIKRCPEENGEIKLDHFKIYSVDTIGLDRVVHLQGQFDTNPTYARILKLFYFANPAGKMHNQSRTQIKYPDGHFNIYTIKSVKEPERKIALKNQFGEFYIKTTSYPPLLMVPAQKLSDAGSSFPSSLDHYKCYEISEVLKKHPKAIVTVTDQFGPELRVIVDQPKYFCVPVKKILEDGSTFTINNPNEFLVIYDIKNRSTDRDIKVKDQFKKEGLHVVESTMFAVPSQLIQ